MSAQVTKRPTCISSDEHNDKVTLPIHHVLGCLQFVDREGFINTEHDEEFREEIARQMRRIRFIRHKISQEPEREHLIHELNQSQQQWRKSREYRTNIQRVSMWRSENGERIRPPDSRSFSPSGEETSEVYEPDRDFKSAVFEFAKSSPRNDLDAAIRGKFPRQETAVKNLWQSPNTGDSEDPMERCIIHHSRHPDRVKLFHIPSNNMMWAKKAIAAYFGIQAPDYDIIDGDRPSANQNGVIDVMREIHRQGEDYQESFYEATTVMHSFCERIEMNDSSPTAISLFMPYLHWETYRNQKLCTKDIEEIEEKEKLHQRAAEIASTEARRYHRRALASTHKEFFDNSVLTMGGPTTGKSSQEPQAHSASNAAAPAPKGQLQSTLSRNKMRRPIRTLDQLIERLNLPRRESLPLDANGLVLVPNPLGQYLLDAARLYEAMVTYRDRKLLDKYLLAKSRVYPRRTLYRARYPHLKTTLALDEAQIAYRETTPAPDLVHTYDPKHHAWHGHEQVKKDDQCAVCTEQSRLVSQLVMVDQLWMWILNSNTIVTCFPKYYNAASYDRDPSDILESLRVRVSTGKDRQVASVFELALIVFDTCADKFFHPKSPYVGLEAYSKAVENLERKVDLEKERLNTWMKLSSPGYAYGRKVPTLDSNVEVALETELSEVRSQLETMASVVNSQEIALEDLIQHSQDSLSALRTAAAPGNDPAGDPRDDSDDSDGSKDKGDGPPRDLNLNDRLRKLGNEMRRKAKDRINKLDGVRKRADSAAEKLRNYILLKRQQTGIVNTWQSDEQREEGNRQGQLFSIFTIVNFIFVSKMPDAGLHKLGVQKSREFKTADELQLPLSFMSSLFGMNTIDFGDGNTMHLNEQLKYIFTITLAISILVLILSFITRSRPFYALTYYVYKKLGTWWLVYTRLYRLYLKIGVSSNTLIDRADHAAEALKARDMQIHFRHRQARMERHQQQQGVQAYNDGNVDHEGARASEQGVRQVRPGLESAQERPFAEV